MMSSSPPHNNNSGYNPYIAGFQITSSPSFNEDLNLQLQNIQYDNSNDNDYDKELNDQSNNYTTGETNVNTNTSDNSISLSRSRSQRNSLSHTQHQNQYSAIDQNDNETIANSTRNSSVHQLDPNDQLNLIDDPNNNQYNYNPNFISMTPQYNQMHESLNETPYEDMVSVSIQPNLENNLDFTVSSPHINPSMTSSATSSSFNSLYYSHQTLSNNSISSSLQSSQQQQQNTPLQPSRRLSASIMHNPGLATTPSTTPLRKQANLTPRLGPNYGQVYTHRRSKSKLQIEKSPNTGNPFYNPPSFLSPKVQKKSHRKNISITNSISLTHLDTDINLQNLHNLNYINSPHETPLRTPGKGLGANYYGDLEKDINSHLENDMDSTIHNNLDIDNMDDRIDMTMDQTLQNKTTDSENYNDIFNSHLGSALDNTFLVPNNRLAQTSNDLNRVLKGNDENDKNNIKENNSESFNDGNKIGKTDNINQINRQKSGSILDSVASSYSNIDLIDDLFPSDQSTVGSLQPNLLFNHSHSQIQNQDQQNMSRNDIFVDDTHEQFSSETQKHPYSHKQTSASSSPEILQSSLQYQLQFQFNEKSMSSLSSPNVLQSSRYLKPSSVPHTRNSSFAVDSKIQRSRSSFNLSDIAASKESKKFNNDYLESYDESPELVNPYETPQIPKSASLQEVAENASSRNHRDSESSSENPNEQPNKPITRSRSKSKRSSFTLAGIKHPEKLDLPQQSARSKSRTKKTIHDDKKIHECPLCHMRFQRPEHVKRHMLSHSSEKPFACPEEGCGKRFNRNDNLKQHLRNIHKKNI